jgi:hypothetical protein
VFSSSDFSALYFHLIAAFKMQNLRILWAQKYIAEKLNIYWFAPIFSFRKIFNSIKFAGFCISKAGGKIKFYFVITECLQCGKTLWAAFL